MSHPDPTHDRSNEYPEDKVSHYPKKKGGLSKVAKVLTSKAKALNKMMADTGGRYGKRK